MGKVSKTCCIENCGNKSGKDENERSFHIFPSESAENYQAWMAAVTPYLKKPKPSQKNFYVCDEHFEQNYFLKEGCTILINGVETQIPRKMKRLKKNSVPSIFYCSQVNNTVCQTSLRPINSSYIDHQYAQTELNILTSALSSSEYVLAGNESTETVDCDQTTLLQTFAVEVPAENVEESIVDSMDDQYTIFEHDNYLPPLLTESEIAPAVYAASANQQYTVVKQGLPSFPTLHHSTINVPMENADDLRNENQVESRSTITSLENMDHLNISAIKSNCNVEKSVGYYSREELINDWRSSGFGQLPENWGMAEISEDLLFVYYGDSACVKSVKKILAVKEDMSTELQLCGRISTYPIVKKINCFDDLLITLTTIKCLQVCAGVKCSDGLFQPIPRSKSVRCSSCQKVYRLEKERERKRTKRAQQRNVQSTKSYKNFKRKYRRYLQKIDSLEGKLDEVMSKCAQADTQKLMEFGDGYPEEMRKTIMACYQWAQHDKKGVHYPEEWILQCVLLLIKCRKAYSDLRDKQILHLPTFTTLSDCMRKMNFEFDPKVFEMLQPKSSP